MTPDEPTLVDTWHTVAVDLGIRVTAPFDLRRRVGMTIQFLALIHDFGSARGALVCRGEEWEKYRPVGAAEGYFVAPTRPPSRTALARAPVGLEDRRSHLNGMGMRTPHYSSQRAP